jgi:hypothetical protein
MRKMVGTKIQSRRYAEAQTVLNTLPETTPEDLYFKRTQQINLDHLIQGVSYQLAEANEDLLIEVAHSGLGIAAHAQALLAMLREVYVYPDIEWPDFVEGRGTFKGGAASLPKYEMKVSPNPAASVLSIQFDLPDYTQARFFLTDLLGQVRKSGQFEVRDSRAEISIHDLDSGMYFLSVQWKGVSCIPVKILIHR